MNRLASLATIGALTTLPATIEAQAIGSPSRVYEACEYSPLLRTTLCGSNARDTVVSNGSYFIRGEAYDARFEGMNERMVGLDLESQLCSMRGCRALNKFEQEYITRSVLLSKVFIRFVPPKPSSSYKRTE